jgi:hypothetical protein
MKEEKVDRIWQAITRIKSEMEHPLRGGRKIDRALMQKLADEVGATYRTNASTNSFRAHGIQATCTWSDGEGLLHAWLAAADRALAKLAVPPEQS